MILIYRYKEVKVMGCRCARNVGRTGKLRNTYKMLVAKTLKRERKRRRRKDI